MKKFMFVFLALLYVVYAQNVGKSDLRIGIGGMYDSHNLNDNGTISSTLGHIVVSGKDFYLDDRVYAELNARWGIGSAKSSGISGFDTKSENRKSGIQEVDIKFGYNLLGQQNPLYVVFGASLDSYGTNAISTISTNPSEQRYGLNILLYSLELGFRGFVRSSSALSIEYGITYNQVLNDKLHRINHISLDNDGFAYGIKGSLGIAYEFNRYVELFANAHVKYFDLPATSTLNPHYPASSNITGMLEFGVGFLGI